MTNKPISEVIAEIEQTRGNRKYCSGLHQSLESDGYGKNIVNWSRVTTPARIDALIDHIAALEQQLANQSAHADSAIYKRIAEQYKTDATLSALISRIAELEQQLAAERARVVKLRKHTVGEVMHMSGFSRDYAEGWCAGNDNAIHEIRVAKIPVEGDSDD